MLLKRLALLLIVLPALFFSGCTRYKNMIYLQEKDESKSIYNAVPPDYRIQKRDVLYIRILSLNQEITQVINSTSVLNTNQFTNDASLFIYGYNVSDSGYVEIPVIGRVEVLGKTLEEARASVSKQTAVFLKDATVIIKLISFKYSVIGEVNRPGIYQNYNNQLTVLEAISNAGDISAFGDRRKVMVIRPGNEGTKTFRLDLTNTDILASDGFFLLPNDIVYIEPMKSYNLRNNLPVLSIFLSGVTTFILILNYIDNYSRTP